VDEVEYKMERWDNNKRKFVNNEKIDKFLLDIIKVCQKHNLSISHEDIHGSFKVEDYNTSNIDWLFSANIDMEG
jgi:hypothetical protein